MTHPQSRESATTPAPTQAASGFPAVEEDAALQLAYAIAAAADERKGANIVILQVGDVSYLADYFVVITGFSTVQVRAITRSIETTLEDNWNRRPLRVEGQLEGNWVLMDYGEVIVHVFMPEAREFYDLEAFWGHANQIAYQPALQQPSV
ncbi:MAG TPA: ribosome silencing factor [Leptolyngbyaceae cyanobacterium M65_K2018_010]|nr:ribosome silencing factor [Leptolyngbyaceae cyanobacterium M65_K2018_010]